MRREGFFGGQGGHLGVASVIGRNLDMFELCTLYSVRF